MSVSFAKVENNQDIYPHCINVGSTQCSDHPGIPHRLGECWEQGQAARDHTLKPWPQSDTQKPFVWSLSSHWKNEMIGFFLLVCVFFLTLFPGDDFSIIQQEIFMVKECTHKNIVAYFGSYLW